MLETWPAAGVHTCGNRRKQKPPGPWRRTAQRIYVITRRRSRRWLRSQRSPELLRVQLARCAGPFPASQRLAPETLADRPFAAGQAVREGDGLPRTLLRATSPRLVASTRNTHVGVAHAVNASQFAASASSSLTAAVALADDLMQDTRRAASPHPTVDRSMSRASNSKGKDYAVHVA